MSDVVQGGAAGAAATVTLGIDLGTSAIKIVALAPDDELIGEGAFSFNTGSALPLQAEQETGDWLRAVSAAMLMLGRNGERELGRGWLNRVGAIGVTGQLPTLVCLAGGRPLAPAITWKDGRADAWAASRIDAATRAAMYAVTGMPIDGRYLAPMLQFHFADRLDEIACLLSAKDYLVSVLTGRRLTEPSTAAGYGIYDLQAQAFSPDLCRFWNVAPALLPELRAVNSLAGPLRATSGNRVPVPRCSPTS